MAVAKIEEYRQQGGNDVLKIYLTPQKHFPEGYYFYADAEDIDLVENHTWHCLKGAHNIYIICTEKDNDSLQLIRYHQALAFKKLGYFLDCIDHRNSVGFDNCDVNLFNVLCGENSQNIFCVGYWKSIYPNTLYWQVRLRISGKCLVKNVPNELVACQLRYKLEQGHFTHAYNILLDRSQSLDILDLERTGKISADEAIYRHIMKYADNAWYYYRYGLEEYFKDNNIPVPSYSLDEQGFMVHPITGQKLCPFTK